MSDVSAGIEPIYSKYYTRRMQTPAGVIMGTYYINREDIKIDVARLNKKYKDKYRFTGRAYAEVHFEPEIEGEWQMRAATNTIEGSFSSDLIYSKTKKGAEKTALTDLLEKCRHPLTKKQKAKNRQLKKEGKEEIRRIVSTEVRVGNSFNFIMGGESTWHEIRKEKEINQ